MVHSLALAHAPSVAAEAPVMAQSSRHADEFSTCGPSSPPSAYSGLIMRHQYVLIRSRGRAPQVGHIPAAGSLR